MESVIDQPATRKPCSKRQRKQRRPGSHRSQQRLGCWSQGVDRGHPGIKLQLTPVVITDVCVRNARLHARMHALVSICLLRYSIHFPKVWCRSVHLCFFASACYSRYPCPLTCGLRGLWWVMYVQVPYVCILHVSICRCRQACVCMSVYLFTR